MTRGSSPLSGAIEVDIHGMTKAEAKKFLETKIMRLPKSVYSMRVIHGYNGGTELRDMVRNELRKNRRVLRVELGLNPGETTLILRDLYNSPKGDNSNGKTAR